MKTLRTTYISYKQSTKEADFLFSCLSMIFSPSFLLGLSNDIDGSQQAWKGQGQATVAHKDKHDTVS